MPQPEQPLVLAQIGEAEHFHRLVRQRREQRGGIGGAGEAPGRDRRGIVHRAEAATAPSGTEAIPGPMRRRETP